MTTSPSSPISAEAPRGFPSAAVTIVPWQRTALLGLLVCLLAGAVVAHRPVLVGVNAAVTVFYLVTTVYRIMLVDLSLRRRCELQIGADELAAERPPDQWPRYLVLLPLYKEGEILPSLVTALSKLDYPAERLEIRLLIEADDHQTMAAAEQLELKPPFRIFPIPVSEPRTKPKACNVGLEDTDADLTVIYDAEDRPDPDQLRKAALGFEQLPTDVVCLQAKLNFYNPTRNLLTRWFTAEYALWFDLCLPALDTLQAPIPLGGTSNHFRVQALLDIGGWDEYNVTEDCDLGLRLFMDGWRTRMLDSTTWEQACPNFGFWIRQRSRWVKGYCQSYLVHTRNLFRTSRRLGLINSLHFHLLIGGTPFSQLVNPFYWALAVVWFTLRPEAIAVYFPGPVFAMAALCLFVGNFALAYAAGIACVRRGFGKLTFYGLTMPIYWAMMSYAAWKGFLQLIRRPHYWEKTHHFGEAQGAAEAS